MSLPTEQRAPPVGVERAKLPHCPTSEPLPIWISFLLIHNFLFPFGGKNEYRNGNLNLRSLDSNTRQPLPFCRKSLTVSPDLRKGTRSRRAFTGLVQRHLRLFLQSGAAGKLSQRKTELTHTILKVEVDLSTCPYTHLSSGILKSPSPPQLELGLGGPTNSAAQSYGGGVGSGFCIVRKTNFASLHLFSEVVKNPETRRVFEEAIHNPQQLSEPYGCY